MAKKDTIFYSGLLGTMTGAILSFTLFPHLCPQNSTPCFVLFTTQPTYLVGGVGALLIHFSKFLSEKKSFKTNQKIAFGLKALGMFVLFNSAGWIIGTTPYFTK